MPAIQNVERRGAVYYWRRTLRFQDGKSLTLRISLRTTDQSVARRMACAMTTKSETLRMTLNDGGRTATLTIDQKADIFRKAMSEMRDQLDRNHVEYQRTDPDDATYLIEGLVGIYETMLRDFAIHGLPPEADSRAHVEERFADLTEDQRESILGMFEMKPNYREHMSAKAAKEVDRVGALPADDAVAIARKVMFEGGLAAAMEFRRRMRDPMALWANVDLVPRPATAPLAMVAAEPVAKEPWASMTPVQAAERYVVDQPKILGDAQRKARWTHKTRSQFVTSARLLEKSYGARPLWRLTQDDVLRLNAHFSRLPQSHHKSSRHDPLSLEEICLEAAREVEEGKLLPERVGLGVSTTNRHFLFLKDLVTWFQRHVPPMSEILWKDVIYEDDRDARQQREAYTEDEGRQMFLLPIWTGSLSLSRRLSEGSQIWHDAGYWVVLIAWYTGLRREEICQLALADVLIEHGIWHFKVHEGGGGRIKTKASKRDVPMAGELVRLGLPDYVQALRAAGEMQLFPELRTESGKQGYGDVFYKNWWEKIAARLPFVEKGQALHSFRHMVTTELKYQHVFLEDRADLVGHAIPGETAGRYSKQARLIRLKEAVDQIPVVTDHLIAMPITLLPADQRAPRKARKPYPRRKSK